MTKPIPDEVLRVIACEGNPASWILSGAAAQADRVGEVALAREVLALRAEVRRLYQNLCAHENGDLYKARRDKSGIYEHWARATRQAIDLMRDLRALLPDPDGSAS